MWMPTIVFSRARVNVLPKETESILSREEAVLRAQTDSAKLIGAVGDIVLFQDRMPGRRRVRQGSQASITEEKSPIRLPTTAFC